MKQLKTSATLLVIGAVLSYFAGPVLAGTTGKIAGTATDKGNNEPLPGVNVVVQGTTMGSATNLEGEYFILNVPPGVYTVVATFIGYQTVRTSNVRVSADLTTTVNIAMSPETLTGESVEIVAQRPLIQKDGVTTMAIAEAAFIENMAADNFKQVLTVNSGVTTVQVRDASFSEAMESGEGEYYVRGGRGNEVAVMVDGLYARDAVSGGISTTVSNSAIEEMQLISGNFNAEYGNAMSGVLNFVTQEGGSRTSLNLRGFTDAIFGKPTRDYTFLERDALIRDNGKLDRENWGTYQGQFSLGGPMPVIGNKLKYFFSGEYFQTDGNVGVLQSEFARRGTAKLTFSPSATSKFTFTGNANSHDQQIYDHLFAHDQHDVIGDSIGVPPGSPPNNFQGNDRLSTRVYQGIAAWTQSLNASSFFDLKLQYYTRTYFDRVHDEPEEYRFLTFNPGEDFVISGDDPKYINQEDRVWQGKFDLTYQVGTHHNVKGGVDLNYHRIWRKQLLTGGDVVNSRVDTYQFNPIEAAAYLQDKMEFKDLIINVGVRVDYIDPADSVAVNLNEPLGARRIADAKLRVSPRLGIAHPVTERANLHFSYGHFYQMPEYNKVIYNHGRYVDIFRPTLGNAELKPQKTVSFEVGWDQQMTDFLALSVIGFYKDIENLVSTDPYPFARPSSVTYYINQDFANSRGIEINLRTRRYNHLASYFSYTIQRAEGNSSNPLDVRDDFLARPPRVALKKLIILDWDRPHIFNFNLDFRYGRGEGPTVGGSRLFQNFGINLTGRFASGVPYTPTDSRGQRIAEENVARMPGNAQLDLRLDKLLNVANSRMGVFLEVTNLTNRQNIVNVYTDTGLPFDTTDPTYTPQGKRDPYNVGTQRNIRLGLELDF